MVAAGTIAYLTREPSAEKLVLATNYLFYLIGKASLAAKFPVPLLAQGSKIVFILTPFVLGALRLFNHQSSQRASYVRPSSSTYDHSFERYSSRSEPEEDSPQEASRLSPTPHIYIVAAACTLVMAAFGHRSYGVGFLAIAALDFLTRRVAQSARKFFTGLAGIPAILSFWSYGLNLSTTPGVQLMVLATVAVFVPRIYRLFNQEDRYYNVGGPYYNRSYSSRTGEEEPTVTTQPSAERKFPAIANLMGPLPHRL